MNICFDGIGFSLQESGGISIYSEKVVAGVVRAGVPVKLWLFPGCEHNKSVETLLALRKDFPAFEVVRVTRRSPLERLRAFRESLEPGSVFHSTYYRLPPKSARVRVVTTVYDFIHERRASRARRAVLSFQKRRAILRADAVVCISARTAADVPRYVPEVDPRRIVVAPLGSDFRPIEGAVSAHGTFALFVGRRVAHKQFPMAVQAVARVKGLRLVIAGGGELSAADRDTLAGLPAERWTAIPWVEPTQLNQLYSTALALLFPSVDEGFGLPVAEAASTGCPAITVRGGIPEDAQPLPELAAHSPAPEALAALLLRLLNPAYRSEVRRRALASAANSGWDRTIGKLMDTYRALA
ncbi:MAG: glycosyltransferase [Pseudomonadota bacterium]